jgi:hypothetical protein
MADHLRATLALLALVALNSVTASTGGFYSRSALAICLLALGFALIACLLPVRRGGAPMNRSWGAAVLRVLLGAAALGLTGRAAVGEWVLYGEEALGLCLIRIGSVAGFILVAATDLLNFTLRRDQLIRTQNSDGATSPTGVLWNAHGRWAISLFGCFILSGACLRLGAVWAAPDPVIDVYGWLRDAPAYLLRGQNPYTADYKSPYGTERANYYGVQELPEKQPAVYPPQPILLALPFAAARLDVRYANVFCDLLAATFLYLAARQRGRVWLGVLLTGLYLHLPGVAFMMEQAWYEPMIAAMLGAGLVVIERGRWWACVPLSLGLTAKQFGIVLLPPLLKANWPLRWCLLASLAGVTLALFLPFVVWDPRGFLSMVLFKHLERPPALYSLTLSAGAYHALGVILPRAVMWAVAVLLVGLISWRAPAGGTGPALWLGSALLVFCLFHTQGNFNYFYLCQYLWLFALAGLVGEGVENGGSETSGARPSARIWAA